MMGCGKSTVGEQVADMLGCPFIDLDREIVRAAGKGIPEIFADAGQEEFRKIELNALRKVLKGGSGGDATMVQKVVALGGGTVTVPAAAALVRENSVCVYLKASVDALCDNLAGQSDGRPLLEGCGDRESLHERLESLLEAREKAYEGSSHVAIDTDGLSPGDIASEIIIDCL